jgi:ATP synthase subunit 6
MIFAPLEQFEILSIFNLTIFSLDVSITNFLIMQLLSIFILILILFFNSADNFSFYYKPNAWQKLFEITFNVICQLVSDVVTKDSETYLPILVLLFYYILFSNVFGLIPYSFTATSHVITTFYLSFSVFLGINFITVEKYGFRSFALFLPANTQFLLALILVPIEFVAYLSKPVSLGVRLFINIMAGHILIKIIVGFSWNLLAVKSWVSTLFIVPLITLVILFGLELGVALIQTYVFMILVCIYLDDAL